MRITTTVWGVAYCLEAVVHVGPAYVLSTGTTVNLIPVLIYGVLVALALWTALYGKRARRKGEERSAAAAAMT
ncbi:hypothetical protein ACH41H_46880 [Streptomyces sp. NPDC020800]|uniref:hypothetical protein n=1 Tax=Streptomyces sp. NPDC020800 TaxID=3365092 RepID=UPI0037B58BF2